VLGGAINVAPVVGAILGLVVIGITLFIAGAAILAVLSFIGTVLFAPIDVFLSMRRGEPVDEFSEIVVFWGGIALIVGLIWAGFHFHVLEWK